MPDSTALFAFAVCAALTLGLIRLCGMLAPAAKLPAPTKPGDRP